MDKKKVSYDYIQTDLKYLIQHLDWFADVLYDKYPNDDEAFCTALGCQYLSRQLCKLKKGEHDG